MRFKLNEESYLLNLDSKKARWYLVTPGRKGLNAIEVINDDAPKMTVDLLVPSVGEETILVG